MLFWYMLMCICCCIVAYSNSESIAYIENEVVVHETESQGSYLPVITPFLYVEFQDVTQPQCPPA